MLRKFIKKILTYPSLPDFYILGAQKAGTTSIDSYLKYHPQLKGCHPKELHFFDNKEKNSKGLKWYKNNFRRFYVGKKKTFFESTPNYLYKHDLPKQLKALKPDLKFIIILRDPVDRAFSAYNMFRLNYEEQKLKGEVQEHLKAYEKNDQFMSFEEVIEEELYRINNNIPQDSFDETFTLLRKGLYKQQIENWQNQFPKERFLILQFEDLKKDPIQLLNNIAKFLNVKSFNNLSIDQKPRNKREYDNSISPETRKVMEDFFKKHQ